MFIYSCVTEKFHTQTHIHINSTEKPIKKTINVNKNYYLRSIKVYFERFSIYFVIYIETPTQLWYLALAEVRFIQYSLISKRSHMNVAFRNQIPKQIKDDRYENKNRKWIHIEQYYFYRCVRSIIAKREKCMKISTEKMKKKKNEKIYIKLNKTKKNGFLPKLYRLLYLAKI